MSSVGLQYTGTVTHTLSSSLELKVDHYPKYQNISAKLWTAFLISLQLEHCINSIATITNPAHTGISIIVTKYAGAEGEDIHSLIAAYPSSSESAICSKPIILLIYFMLSL